MNFSKYKLHKYLTEGQADMSGTGGALSASRKATAQATNGTQVASQLQVNNKSQQVNQSTQKTNVPAQSKIRYEGNDEYHSQLIKEKEAIKAFESQKSDWRTELQEKVVDGQERQQHPYVTVMPTGDENLIQAVEQMAKTAKKKKEDVTEEYKDLPKRKMGMKAGKKTLSGIGHALKTGSDGVGSIEDQKRGQQADKKAKQADKIHNVAASHSPAKSKLKEIKNKLKGLTKEETEVIDIEEAKKKCKDGYKYDSEKKKCVKKKKSSSKKSTTIIVGRPLYGGGLHHHHHDDDDNEGGGNGNGNGGGGESGGGGGEGGGMGEMFDLLGDMLLKEKADMSRYKTPEAKEIERQMKATRENLIPKGGRKSATKPTVYQKPLTKAQRDSSNRYN